MPPNDGTEYQFDRAGKGWLRYSGLAVDEPRAVGAMGLTDAQRMARALDVLGNRQFLDRIFNSATKGHFEQGPGPVPGPLPIASVVDKPWVIWRPTLENVVEWREFSTFIRNKVQSRVQNKTSPAEVKEIINEAIRNELKRPTTDAGRKLHDSLKSQTGVNPEDLFRPVRISRAKWSTNRPWNTSEGRNALFNAGVLLAGFIVAQAESASAEAAHTDAKQALEALSDTLGRYATDHPDQGTLVVQVYELRKMNAESAATTTYRYTTTSHGRKEHEALWNSQDQAGLGASTDAFSQEYKAYIWVPPLNERGTIPGPPPR